MRRGRWFAWASLAVLLAGCGPVADEPPPATPAPEIAPSPLPTPEPTPFVRRQPMDTGMMFNGLQYHWNVEKEPGATAAREREVDDAYRLELHLRIREPRPATTMEDLAVVNARLPELIPSLPQLVETADVSPAFARIYELKFDWLKGRLRRLENILSRHNYYDCDTILEFEHPDTGRRALFIQSEMDVNVDGSDGDRNVEVDGSGQFFQPQTSYRWRKKTDRPNPFLAPLLERRAAAEKELKDSSIKPARARELREQIERFTVQIRDLERWSFLVSETDPFIVIPGFMLRGDGPHVPKMGDYAVVIHEDKIYPAIVGDAGPSYKMGEASLRLCKEINDTGTPLARPVSDLHVTYLVFPGSAEPERDAPDLELWHERCAALLAELGAPDAVLHHWEDIVPPWPEEVIEELVEGMEDETPGGEATEGGEVAPEASPTPTP